jgi:DNA-binding GntR family transcriptional regulator
LSAKPVNTSRPDSALAGLTSMGNQVPTLKAAAHQRLEDAILELELPPGTRLVEADLAERFEISKTPIREALLQLANDWLVELVPHTGARVTWLSVIEYAQLVELLDRLEVPSLPAVTASITNDQLAAFDSLVADLKDARAAEDGVLFRNLLLQVHGQLFKIVSSPHLTRMINWIGRLTRRYECAFTHHFPDTWDLELQLVCDRIEFIRKRDADGAARAVHEVHAKLTTILRERADYPELAQFLR